MSPNSEIVVVNESVALPVDAIAQANQAAQTGKQEISQADRNRIIEYFRLEAWKKHKNRHNTPFDAQLRNKKRAKVKRSRRANLDRLLRDKK